MVKSKNICTFASELRNLAMVPQNLTIIEISEIMCTSTRTIDRRVREVRDKMQLKKWSRIPTEKAIQYLDIPREKVEKYFKDFRVY